MAHNLFNRPPLQAISFSRGSIYIKRSKIMLKKTIQLCTSLLLGSTAL